jgi:uncharacterized membrane protein
VNAVQLDAVEAYINEVRERLADVPEEDRVDLLDDVAAHVREIADEFGAEALHERLGTPEEFTTELRASAGYGAPTGSEEAPPAPSRLRRSVRWIDSTFRTDANRALWRKLEPGWFVLRGVLAGFLVSRVTGAGGFGVVLMAAGAVASYRLGDRRPATQKPSVRRLRVAAEVGLALVALATLHSSSDRIIYVDSGGPAFAGDPCLRDGTGQPIGNLYAFDPQGQLIPQFFLTDQAGRPIQNLCPDAVTKNGYPVGTEYVRDVNGAPVYGVFPRKQTATNFDQETNTMTKEPVVPPAVVFPQLSPPTTAASVAEAPPEETPQQ